MALFPILIVGAIACFLKYWYDKTKIVKGFPTGPLGLPIIGYPGLFKAANIPDCFDKLKDQ